VAPLTPAADALVIDTSDLSREEACAQAVQYVEHCLGVTTGFSSAITDVSIAFS
jgi:cytidylate kinase